MADFAFPLPALLTDPLPYFSRPGVIIPEPDTPQQGIFETAEDWVDSNRMGKGGILPNPAKATSIKNRHYYAEPFILPTTYSEFWKNKLHVIPRTVDFGNILSPKQQQIELYNAYEYPSLGAVNGVKEVNGIQILNDVNTAFVSGNTTTPFTLGLQQGEVYVYEVGSFGSATINGDINFQFTSGELVIHYFNGTRSVAFTVEPQLPVREAFMWLTDVMQSVDGTERRQSLRELPRQQISYTYLSGDNVLQPEIENFLRTKTALEFEKGIPVWLDRTHTTAAVAIGDTVIPVEDTTDRDFRSATEQGLCILYDPADRRIEIGTISSFTATSITLVGELLQAWPERSEIYPMRLASLKPEGFNQRLWLQDARETSIIWDVITGVDNGSEAGWSTYKSTAVFEDDLTIGDTDSYQRQWKWELKKLGGNTSRTGVWSSRGSPSVSSKFTLFWDTRAEHWRLRRWLMARRGQQKSFWLTTRRDDFVLYQNETALGANFRCERNNYNQVFPEGNYVDIEVVYTDGTRDYREVTQVLDAPGLYHIITVNSNFSKIMNNTNVWRISLMIKHRLASDTVEFFHETTESGSVLLDVTEIQE